jgi:trimethylamine--corrinoid protein Co-methyltransferase
VRGIEVNDETLALDEISRIGFSGNYLAEEHTVRNFRKEHYIPSLPVREPLEAWQEKGSKGALQNARERVRILLEKHTPNTLDPVVEKTLISFKEETAARQIETYYACELPENQNWESF